MGSSVHKDQQAKKGTEKKEKEKDGRKHRKGFVRAHLSDAKPGIWFGNMTKTMGEVGLDD